MRRLMTVLLCCGATLFTTVAAGQEKEAEISIVNGTAVKTRQFTPVYPQTDKEEAIDIRSVGGASFSTSNQSDGTLRSFRHNLKVTLELVAADAKAGKIKLTFYGEGENIPYAFKKEGDITHVYFPVVIYDDIKARLDQSFAARKKVTLKLVEKTTGFREAELNF